MALRVLLINSIRKCVDPADGQGRQACSGRSEWEPLTHSAFSLAFLPVPEVDRCGIEGPATWHWEK